MKRDNIHLVLGDITKQNVQALVNAAKTTLLGGGGVDGAIHRGAGPELLMECMTLNGCNPGDAKITKGYNLHAKYVIHTVGPVWDGGQNKEDEILMSCYNKSLALSVQNNIQSVAFPCISTGVFGFPQERAAHIAVKAVLDFPHDLDVIFCCFLDSDYKIYKEILNKTI